MRYDEANSGLFLLHCLKADLDDAGVLTIAFNRPAERNRIDVALTLEMDGLLQAVAGDPAVRVVVLRGEGADFSAGVDASDFADAARHGAEALPSARAALASWSTRRLAAMPQPVVAMVHGACHGGAIAVVEGCDIAFAADDAEFVLAEPDGAPLAPGLAGKSASRVMAPRAARLHALSGRPFDGREAERNGLATCSFALADLARETDALARELAAKDPLALRFTKDTLRHVGSMDWDAVLDYTAAKLAELKSLQAGRPSARAAAVESFLAGKSKPGLGG